MACTAVGTTSLVSGNNRTKSNNTTYIEKLKKEIRNRATHIVLVHIYAINSRGPNCFIRNRMQVAEAASNRREVNAKVVAIEYSGCSVKNSSIIPVINEGDARISSPLFFWTYIQQRQPCLIHGLPPSSQSTENKASWRVDRTILENVAGDQVRLFLSSHVAIIGIV